MSLPVGRPDSLWNRVDWVGSGTILSPFGMGPDSLRNRVDPKCRGSVRLRAWPLAAIADVIAFQSMGSGVTG